MLQLAASLDHGSSPPLAGAIVKAAEAHQLPLLPRQAPEALLAEGVQAHLETGSRELPVWLGYRRLANRHLPLVPQPVQRHLNQWRPLATR